MSFNASVNRPSHTFRVRKEDHEFGKFLDGSIICCRLKVVNGVD